MENKYRGKTYSEGMAQIMDDKSHLFGFINRQGNEVIPCRFAYAGQFKNGLSAAKKPNGLWGYINHQGEYVIKPQYLKAWPFDKTYKMAVVANLNNKSGAIDALNRQKIPFCYQSIPPQENWFSGLIKVMKDDKEGIIDTSGRVIIPVEYDWIILSDNKKTPESTLTGIISGSINTLFDVDSLKGHQGNIIEWERERGVLDIIEWLDPITAVARLSGGIYGQDMYGVIKRSPTRMEIITEGYKTPWLAKKHYITNEANRLVHQEKNIGR